MSLACDDRTVALMEQADLQPRGIVTSQGYVRVRAWTKHKARLSDRESLFYQHYIRLLQEDLE